MDYFDIIRLDPVNHYIVLKEADLIKIKNSISKKEINILEEKLNYLLDEPYYNVMMKPRGLVRNINRHNYVSLATYYHPNPNTESGLPYIQKDGYANPEGEKFDKDKLRKTAYICYYELLLYYLTDNVKYYEDAKKRILTFFVDSKTKMLPNMNHAQMIRGVNMGRGIGIIDFSANFSYTLILLHSLYKMNKIEIKFYDKFKRWLSAYLDWLEYSDIALEERDSKNNHGIMYDFLKLVLYRIFNKKKEIKSLVYSFIDQRLQNSFAEDGSMPLELARTKSISYSLMGFKGIFDFAHLLDDYDLYDLNWYYKKVNFEIKNGFNFLLQHLVISEDWKYSQVVTFDKATLVPLITEAKIIFSQWKDIKYPEDDVIDDVVLLVGKSLSY